NNSTLYQNQSNGFTRAVYVALMGDPTLRLDQVAPPSALAATAVGNVVNLNWGESTDSVLGYHVYRTDHPSGPYARLTSSLVSKKLVSDLNVAGGSYTYMGRGVTLQTTPSGTYSNASQGIFASTSVQAVPPPMTLIANQAANNMQLSWNSQPGSTYRIQ